MAKSMTARVDGFIRHSHLWWSLGMSAAQAGWQSKGHQTRFGLASIAALPYPGGGLGLSAAGFAQIATAVSTPINLEPVIF